MTTPPAPPPAAQTREPGWYWAVPNAGFEERPYEYDAGMWWWDGHPHDESEMQKIGPRIPSPAERPGIFANHNCWKCKDGTDLSKCPTPNRPGNCGYPHARNN